MGRLFTGRMRNRLLQVRMGKKPLAQAARANLTALDHLDGSKPAGSFGYTVVDIETTGLDLKQSRIVSIGAFKMRKNRIHLGAMFNQLVNPDREFSPASIAVHGIVPAMVATAPSGPEALDAFLHYLDGDILVAHNAWFDMAFINRLMCAHHGFALQNMVIDSLPLCELLLLPKISQPMPRKPKLLGRGALQPARRSNHQSLEAIANHLGIRIHRRHSAVGDALATAMIFQRILAKLEHRGQGRLKELIRFGAI